MPENPPKNRAAKSVKVTLDTLQALKPFADQMGLDIPGLVQFQTTLDIDQPDTEVARALGAMCSRQPIFRRGDALVALDDEGRMRLMTAQRLGGWVEKFVTTIKSTKDKGEHAASILEAQAGRLLANDAFLVQIRKLDFYFPVRVPGPPKEDGTVELLDAGYDERTRSWTEPELEYEEDWDLDRALDLLEMVMGEMPFADLAAMEEPGLGKSRNAAVVLAGMLGTYCRAFFPPGTVQPMVIISGSQPGVGKMKIFQMMTAPVRGITKTNKLPRSDERFERLLDNAALGMQEILLLDDVGRRLKNDTLNSFITESLHSGMTMYKNENYEMPAVTQVFVTGNDLDVDDNLARRCLQCELYLPGEVQGREFKVALTDRVMGSASFRSKLLSACWAVVREWAAWRAAGTLQPRKKLASFEDYTEVVCAMTQVVGWRDPLDTPEGITGGDTETRDFKELLGAMAKAQTVEVEDYTTTQLVDQARKLGLLEDLVGDASDGPLNKRDRIRFGRRLQKYRGAIEQREDGCFFQFGKRDGKGGSVYPCRLARTREELF